MKKKDEPNIDDFSPRQCVLKNLYDNLLNTQLRMIQSTLQGYSTR